MLFFTPKVAHKLNWNVRNQAEGTSDKLAIVVTEGPSGGPRSTVRAIVLRKRRDGSEYLDVASVPERFLELREEIIEAIDGPTDSPYTLSDLMQKVTSEHEAFVAEQEAAATIAS